MTTPIMVARCPRCTAIRDVALDGARFSFIPHVTPEGAACVGAGVEVDAATVRDTTGAVYAGTVFLAFDASHEGRDAAAAQLDTIAAALDAGQKIAAGVS